MDFSKWNGLVPAVVQDERSNEVLMVGFMNDTALARTRETGFATFFSRTRQKLWTKGETSGNKLAVQQILVDCDDDTVLVKVKRLGDGHVCHTGERTCFFRALEVTQVALADMIASAAGLASGEGAEGVPVVLVRGCRLPVGETPAASLIRPIDQDLFT